MRARWFVGVAPLLLTGCAFGADVAGLAAGGGAGAATANPAIGFAVGIGVRAGVDELGNYLTRRRHGGEQDAIADAAGNAPLNEVRPWRIRHTIPVGNAHGTLAVVREVSTPLATCREVLFTVEDDGTATPFTTSICRNGGRWQWAAAEPAVPRWGLLQH
ncbi:MAG TPA: hypothetical protein VGC15_13410 [Acetobacteraceae bacterium]